MRGAAARAAPFDAAWLARRLEGLLTGVPPVPRLLVGWSGGADSTALLTALLELRASRAGRPRTPPIHALHVDHGLQAASGRWAAHCRREARRLGVPLRVVRVDAARQRGESPEAAARRARHAAFDAELAPGEALLLAHHARDQLETILLHLVRGSGPTGLAAMRARRPFGGGLLMRPLLEVEPEALRDYLRSRGLGWIEDPSNEDRALDRNYLRAEVLPQLQARWPALLRTTARVARHLSAAREEGEEAAGRRLARVLDGDAIALPLLRRLPALRWPGVLRLWITRSGHRLPDEARLAELSRLVFLREDAQARVAWEDCEARVHQGRLLLLAPRRRPATSGPHVWNWRSTPVVELPGGTLRLRRDARGDIDLDALPATLTIRARPRGRARSADGTSVDVKSLLRESGTPAWQREGLPFVFASADDGQALLAIADLWITASLIARADSPRRGRFVWQPC